LWRGDAGKEIVGRLCPGSAQENTLAGECYVCGVEVQLEGKEGAWV